MALCTITGFVYMPNGQPAADRLFKFKPSRKGIVADYFGAVVPEVIEATTDSLGFLTVQLLTGNYVAFSALYNGPVVVPEADEASLYEVFGGTGSVTPPAIAPNFTTLPSLLGSTALGGVITVDLGAANGSPEPVITGTLTRPGSSPIAVTQGQLITVQAGDQGGSLSLTATATNSAGVDTETVSRAVPAAIPAPTLTTPLPDQSLTVGDANVTLALGSYFANASSYAVSPTGQGVTISGSTLTISAAALRNDTYTVTASNSTGQSISDVFALVVEAVVTPAPTVITAPSASPSTVTVGDNVTITQGTYANATSVSRVLMQGTTDRTSQIVDGVWSPGTAVSATYTETPTGPGGSGTPQVVNITVNAQAVPLLPSDFHTYATTDDAPAAVGAELTALQARGAAAPLFGIIGNTANPLPSKEADAIRFNGGRQFQVDLASMPAGDGFILAADFTVRSVTGTNQVVSLSAGTSQLGALRLSGTTIQPYIGPAVNGTAVNLAAGTTAIGQRIVMAIEFDRVAGTVRFWNNGAQQITSQAVTYSSVMAATRIILGQLGNLSLHRVAILTRAQGAPWSKTFSEVLADFL